MSDFFSLIKDSIRLFNFLIVIFIFLSWLRVEWRLSIGFPKTSLDLIESHSVSFFSFKSGKRDIIFHLPNEFSIKLPINSRVSLFPFKHIKNVEAIGLKYPVEDISFSPIGKIGTSNVSTSENIKISYNKTV